MTYGYALEVPLAGWTIARAVALAQAVAPTYDAAERTMLAAGRLPVTAVATVRMHSRAHLNPAMVAAAELPRVKRVRVGGGAGDDPVTGPGNGGVGPPNPGGGDGTGGGPAPGSDDDSDYGLDEYEEPPRDTGEVGGDPDGSDNDPGGRDEDVADSDDGTGNDPAGDSDGNPIGDLEWDALLLAAAAAAELHCLLTPEEVTPWSAEDLLAYEASSNAYDSDGRGFARHGIRYKPADGFAANLTRVGEGEEAQWILAFRGTELTDLGDWETNVLQALLGRSEQYDQAVELARDVKDALGDDVLVAGHSLGGGMAAAAAYATGWRAITFNAAGLHPSYQEDTPGDIRAHYITGELLTTLQGMTPLPSAVGTPIAHSASCAKGPVRRHRVAAFEESLARWEAAQAAEGDASESGTTEGISDPDGEVDPTSGLPIYVPSAERGRAAEVSP